MVMSQAESFGNRKYRECRRGGRGKPRPRATQLVTLSFTPLLFLLAGVMFATRPSRLHHGNGVSSAQPHHKKRTYQWRSRGTAPAFALSKGEVRPRIALYDRPRVLLRRSTCVRYVESTVRKGVMRKVERPQVVCNQQSR